MLPPLHGAPQQGWPAAPQAPTLRVQSRPPAQELAWLGGGAAPSPRSGSTPPLGAPQGGPPQASAPQASAPQALPARASPPEALEEIPPPDSPVLHRKPTLTSSSSKASGRAVLSDSARSPMLSPSRSKFSRSQSSWLTAGDLPNEAADDEDDELARHWEQSLRTSYRSQMRRVFDRKVRHAIKVGICLVMYTLTLASLPDTRHLESSLWDAILNELHPDSAKVAERLKDGEIVPEWTETMHADDVTQNLNWFQTFCWWKGGVDEHLPMYWSCDIVSVETDISGDSAGDPVLPGMNCSPAFVDAHIRRGDDPRCVPWGKESLPQLQRLHNLTGRGGAANLAAIDEQYDEWETGTAGNANPVLDDLVDEIAKLRQELGAGGARPRGLGRAAPRRVAGGALAPDLAGGLGGGPGAARRRLGATPGRGGPRGASPGGAAPRRAATAGQGCPPEPKACPAFAYEGAEMPCRCFREGGASVHSACANHHWGLVHLCEPKALDVTFAITQERCTRHPGGQRSCIPAAWFFLGMHFVRLEDAVSIKSGWYHTRLSMSEVQLSGSRTTWRGVVVLATVAMLLWFTLQGPLWFFVCFPCHLRSILALRDESHAKASFKELALFENSESDTSQRSHASNPDAADDLKEPADLGAPGLRGSCQVTSLFEWRVCMLINGRGTRWKYMTFVEMTLENFAGLCIILGFLESVFYSNKDYFQEEGGAGEVRSAYEYVINHFGGIQLVFELTYALFFQEGASHCYAWMLMYISVLIVFFDHVKGLKWLPAIVRICAIRLLFIILAYAFVLTGFAVIFWLRFGERLKQFMNPSRSFCELAMLAAGMPMHVFDHIKPWEDQDSLSASILLMVYAILVVIIMLNFFTSIVLDAYQMARDPRRAEKNVGTSRHACILMMMDVLGVRSSADSDDEGVEVDLDDFDPLAGSADEDANSVSTLRSSRRRKSIPVELGEGVGGPPPPLAMPRLRS